MNRKVLVPIVFKTVISEVETIRIGLFNSHEEAREILDSKDKCRRIYHELFPAHRVDPEKVSTCCVESLIDEGVVITKSKSIIRV